MFLRVRMAVLFSTLFFFPLLLIQPSTAGEPGSGVSGESASASRRTIDFEVLSATGFMAENPGLNSNNAGESTEHDSTEQGIVQYAGSSSGGENTGEHGERHSSSHGAATHEQTDGGHGHGPCIGRDLPPWTVLPFVGILLSIAVFPLVATEFWHHHFPKITLFWALLFAVPFLISYGDTAVHEILHIYLIDYIPFILLLWSLFTISGGIMIRGSLVGTPMVNAGIILIGTILASWIGTTGSSMLLIRPLLRANQHRKKKVHIVVFFIFLVSNIGGSLTPLGDPPLFLGFLHGVPFFWTMNLMPHMAFVSIILLALFFAIDTLIYKKEAPSPAPDSGSEPLRMVGSYNFLFLGGVLGAVLMSGVWKPGGVDVLGVEMGWQNICRDLLLIAMGVASLVVTPKILRKENEFTWFPIMEVAYLFAGIFMTIIPALAILKAGAEGSFAPLLTAVRTPANYFWITGVLSSLLDNAPTYLTFFNSALGRFFPGMPEAEAVARLIAEQEAFLKAIAAGAVFMGANTYIGNAPNFMVKSIAEESGIPMPSFFGYMFKYSLPILVPVFIIVSLAFFS